MESSQQSNNISWGLSLIFVGALFLLDNLGVLNANLTNWWAIFILMPGFNMLYGAWSKYRSGNNNSLIGTPSFLTGLGLVGLGLSFLLNFNWEYFLPIIIILIGLSMLTKK